MRRSFAAACIALALAASPALAQGGNNADGLAPIPGGLSLFNIFPYVWNGTGWDRLYGDKTNGAWVNCKSGCSTPSAGATGGATPGNEIVPNNTTGVSLKGGAGTVYGVQLGGIGSAPAYLKLYDKATSPTCGTDTPIKRLIIPAAATAANGAGSNISFPVGIKFALGIGYCVTTGIGDSDTTAPAANIYLVNVDWN
jgi:hypothetical protein